MIKNGIFVCEIKIEDVGIRYDFHCGLIEENSLKLYPIIASLDLFGSTRGYGEWISDDGDTSFKKIL